MSAASPRTARGRGLAVLILVLLVAAGVCQTSVGEAVLRKVGIIGAPPIYTSLSFVRPHSLPEQLRAKRSNVIISFQIHNAGSERRIYEWRMLLSQGKRARKVDVGTAAVNPQLTAVIDRSVEVTCTKQRVQVVVQLMRPTESIDAWATCSARRD